MGNNRKSIMENVYFTYLPATKFKTNCISIHFVTPLNKNTASLNALLPFVLRRGSQRFPDLISISKELDTLYGAQIDSSLRKRAERQCLGFVGSFIDDSFTPNGERLLEPLVEIMCELLLDPVTKNGRFLQEYVDSEKNNLIDSIRSIKNDKRDWADVRLMQEMCASEPYGILRLGDEESVKKINAQKLFKHYQELIRTCRIEIIYIGSAPEERVVKALLKSMCTLPRGIAEKYPPIERLNAPEVPNVIIETMDVTQGKLSMGWRCESDDTYALIMANLLFGGTSNSKLFMNVREKLSLCYYASSSFARSKSIMTVSSGIENENYDKTKEEIIKQLENIKEGQWEDWEWNGAMAMMTNSLESVYDSQGGLEGFYLGNVVTDISETPEEMIEEIRKVTPERVCKAAECCHLDTVYFLKGKDEQ